MKLKKFLGIMLSCALALNSTLITIGANETTVSASSIVYDETKFEIDENGVLTNYKGTDTEVVIPDGVTAIGLEVFYSNFNLVSITIPNSVTSIEVAAFCNCINLANVIIPNSVTSIGDSAFF